MSSSVESPTHLASESPTHLASESPTHLASESPTHLASKTVVFTGGGTAGHVIPMLPVIETLKAAGVRVAYIGSHAGPEKTLVAPLGVSFHGIATGKLRRYLSWQNITDVGRVLLGIVQAWWLLGRVKPALVVSKGGFVSFPVVFAAWLRRIPVIAHESDQTPGLANRMCLPFVETLCTNFPPVKTQPGLQNFHGRIVHTGTPIREQLLAGDADRGRRFLGFEAESGDDDVRPILVCTGGSGGAEKLNAVIRDSLAELVANYRVVHICGPGKAAPVAVPKQVYRQYEFINDEWGDVLAAADLVISRAGANTLYELLVLRKLNLLVPLPANVSRGDQIENAAFAADHGYSQVCNEETLTVAFLLNGLANLTSHAVEYRQRIASFPSPDATAEILMLICEVLDRQ